MKPYTALGAYIFAGGFTTGVQDYFDVIAHFEGDDYGKRIKDLNFPQLDTFFPPWPQSGFNVDFIFCNPPCAPWSSAANGRSVSWQDDPRVDCFRKSFALLDQLKPRVLAIETVLAGWRKAPEFFLELALRANDLGYSASIVLHDGKYLNLPQVRRRMFVVFHDIELDWSAHKPYPLIPCEVALAYPPIDYHGDQSIKIDEHTKMLLNNRRQFSDNTLLAVHDRLGHHKGRGSRRPVFTSSICIPGKPAPTLLHAMHVHPIEQRYLSIREMSRLCGFPDWFSWNVKLGPASVASLIARGVTPPVGRHLAYIVAKSLDRNKAVTKPCTEIVDILKGPINRVRVEFE